MQGEGELWQVSRHHNVHDVLGVAVFLALVLAPLVLARAFRADNRWSNLRRSSLITGALTFALLLAFGAKAVSGWNGLVQRLLLACRCSGSRFSGRASRDPSRHRRPHGGLRRRS